MKTKKSAIIIYPTLMVLIALQFSLAKTYGSSQHKYLQIAMIDTLPEKDTAINNKIFSKVDLEANFPGGDKAWLKFLENNLNPSIPKDNGAPSGKYTVLIQFVIDKEGNVTEIEPLTNLGYGMETEVIRLLKKAPQWTPASLGKQAVKVYRKQPITFIVEKVKKKNKH